MLKTLQLAKALMEHGFAFLNRFAPSLSSDRVFALLGTIQKLEELKSVQTLMPHRKDDAAPNTYSGNFGTSSFPLHSDLAHWAIPPRFIALRCIQGVSGIATPLLDGKLLVESFGVEPLRRALVQPRRPLRNQRQLLRLLDLSEDRNQYIFRWDGLYLTPASPHGEQVFAGTKKLLSDVATIDVCLEEPGDTLLIDNWRMLHGRSSIPEKFSHRHLERAYLSAVL